MPKEKSKSEKKREAIMSPKLKVFSFPAHGISIEAEDMQSALKKLESLTPESDV